GVPQQAVRPAPPPRRRRPLAGDDRVHRHRQPVHRAVRDRVRRDRAGRHAVPARRLAAVRDRGDRQRERRHQPAAGHRPADRRRR
ncbi:MAG: DedA protein, partial [uncultured Phycisphaerae bacterium]